MPYISLSPAQPKVARPPASLSWLLRVSARAAVVARVRVCSLWLNCDRFCYNSTKWVYFSTSHIHVRFLRANSLIEKWHGYLETDSPISVRLTEIQFVNLLTDLEKRVLFWIGNPKELMCLQRKKLNEIGQTLEHSPRKFLSRLSQETGVSQFSAWKATKLLKLKPYKITVVQEL